MDGILPKGPYPPCLRMADTALLARYPRYMVPLLAMLGANVDLPLSLCLGQASLASPLYEAVTMYCPYSIINTRPCNLTDSKVHGAIMGPIWGRQDPGEPHVGPVNFAIWAAYCVENSFACPYLVLRSRWDELHINRRSEGPSKYPELATDTHIKTVWPRDAI